MEKIWYYEKKKEDFKLSEIKLTILGGEKKLLFF